MTEKKTNFFGLNAEQVAASREKHGANLLHATKKKSFMRCFIENLGDPVIKILLAALVVNVIFTIRGGEWYETAGIALSVFLATFISTASEYGSKEAFEKLSRESAGGKCTVRRVDASSGRVSLLEIPTSEVVVGDIIILTSGARIPADGKLISGRLGVDQSALTGESRAVSKMPTDEFSPDASHVGSLFGGSVVLSGEGEAEICRVGDSTFLGQISREIQTETRQSPLKIRLTALAKQISIIGYVAAALCAFAYLFNAFGVECGFSGSEILRKLRDTPLLITELLHALTLGLTVVVMAVPEGLPMMIAVVLSSNIKKMVRDNVLVRKPVGIEAAGSMNILFTDKTGTLTEGKMTVGAVVTGDGKRISIRELDRFGGELYDTYRLFCQYGGGDPNARVGNPTELAMADSSKGFPRIGGYTLSERVPFDSSKKYSGVRLTGKQSITLIKGAPEIILPRVSRIIDESGKSARSDIGALERRLAEYSSEGWRVITLAKGRGGIASPQSFGELTLIGFVLLADRPRVEAAR